jgi:hypothetical protein
MLGGFWRRRASAAGLAACALAVLAACGASTTGSPGSRHAQLSLTSNPVMAGPGQVRSRSQVPWSTIGLGWALAQTLSRHSEALFLVDPDGGRYDLGPWPGSTLTGWSADGTMALFGPAPVQGAVSYVSTMDLRTGKVTRFRIGSSEEPADFAQPSDNSIVMLNGTIHDTLFTVDLQGRAQHTIWRGFTDPGSVLYSADGRLLALDSNGTTELINSSTGSLIRKLAGPPDCMPVRWWNTSTLLASCTAGQPTGPINQPTRLWLLPVTGSTATPLGPAPTASGFYQNALGAWQLASGTYLTGSGNQCGFVAQLHATDSLRLYRLPGAGSVTAVTATRTKLLVLKSPNCQSFVFSLSWYSPATGKQTLVIPSSRQAGVLMVLPFPAHGSP